jgi:hypothetical protein
MDDLKFYASTEHQLSQLLSLTETFSKDIKMSFGNDRCKTQCVRRDRRQLHGFQLEGGGTIEPTQEGENFQTSWFLTIQLNSPRSNNTRPHNNLHR